MVGIALDLGGPAVMRLDQQTRNLTRERSNGRIKVSAAIIFNTVRRELPSNSSVALAGNSRSTHSRNSGVSDN